MTWSVGLLWLAALVVYWSVAPESSSHTLAGLALSYLVLWGVVFLWSTASRTETAKRFLLASASLALTAGLLEVLVLTRIVDFRVSFGTPIWEPWEHPGNRLDPTLLHIHKPHDRWPWYGIDYRYDQRGLRNEKDLEAADIVVIGDSFIEGLGVSAPDLVTSELARQLDRSVANVSQSWYGPHQELELIRRFGLPLRPELCIWGFFEGNDLDDVYRYEEATRDWPTFSADLHSFRERSFTKNFTLALRRVIGSSHGRGDDGHGSLDRSGMFEEASGKKTRLYFSYAGHHLSTRDAEALDEVRSILVQANGLCRSVGARFLVLFVPTKFRVYASVTEFETHSQPRYWVVNDLPRRLEALVRSALPDAEFLDLTLALAEQAAHGVLVYFPNDSHWSPEGHRTAAVALAGFVRRWEAGERTR